MGWRRGAAILVAFGIGFGCATRPAAEQDWVEVKAPYFRILSSLSRSATAQLALDLALFRRGVELLAGEDLPAPAGRILVIAFDDRRPGRPFSRGGSAGYLLTSAEGAIVVLREDGGWRGDADEPLRHALAHVLLRSRDGIAAPLWYDEGIAQLASTIDARDPVALVGDVRADHLRLLRGGARVPVRTLLELESFETDGAPDPRIFAAESWALDHYLFFGRRAPRRAPSQLLALASGASGDDDLQRVLGMAAAELDQELERYPARAQTGAVEVRVGDNAGSASTDRPISRREGAVELGGLALALGRGQLARQHFETALGGRAQADRARVGLAAADILERRWDGAFAALESLPASDAQDPRVACGRAELLHTRAVSDERPAQRQRLLALARQHYRRCLDLDAGRPGAWAGLAATHLLDEPTPETGPAFQALDRALALNPASLEIRRLQARLLLAAGRPEEAQEVSRAVGARAHPADLELPLPSVPDAGAQLD